jgi:hypothetical protein
MRGKPAASRSQAGASTPCIPRVNFVNWVDELTHSHHIVISIPPSHSLIVFSRKVTVAYVVFLLSLPAALEGQTPASPRENSIDALTIHGIVADSVTGERIPGANVTILGTNRGAPTNNSGFYLISNVPPGTYVLAASAVGYARRTVRVTVSGSEPITADIKIAAQAVEMGEFIVLSQRLQSLAERSASIHVITPKELQELPAVAQPDLLRSLQLLPGVSSTSDVSAKFYVRGGAGDQNLILMDGMKIYNPFHAFGLFSVLDPDIVRNAEVYTGAFPAGYGGRLSSVVNVTTRDGNISKVSGIANVNFLSGKLELDGPIMGDNSWLLNGRTSLFTGTVDRIIPNPSPMSFYDLFLKGTIGTPTGRIGIRGYVSGDDVEPKEPYQPSHSWRNGAVSAVLSSLMSDQMYVDASLSYSRSESRRTPGSTSTVTPAYSRLEEVTARCDVTSYTDDQNTFFEGFELNFPSITDSLYTYSGYPRRYVDSNIDFYAWARVQGKTGSFLYDIGLHSDVTLLLNGAPLRQGVQPRVTISYDIDGNWRAKASFGIFTQKLIAISNEDDLISLFDAWVYLPSNLQPEEAHHYVIGIEGNIFPWLATSIQGYSKVYRSITVYNPAKVFPSDPDYLNGTGSAYGAEALLRYSSSVADLYASYSWSTVTLSQGSFTYAPRYDRRHAIKALATVHFAEGFSASLRWEYASGYPYTQSAGYYSRLPLSDIGTDPFPGGIGVPYSTLGDKNAARLPAYHRLDLGLSYSKSVGMVRATISANIINLINVQNILYYDRKTGKTDYMTPFFPTASITVEF